MAYYEVQIFGVLTGNSLSPPFCQGCSNAVACMRCHRIESPLYQVHLQHSYSIDLVNFTLDTRNELLFCGVCLKVIIDKTFELDEKQFWDNHHKAGENN